MACMSSVPHTKQSTLPDPYPGVGGGQEPNVLGRGPRFGFGGLKVTGASKSGKTIGKAHTLQLITEVGTQLL